jgi:hypothetical protein
MPNPEVMIFHRFKYDTAHSGVSFVQSLPSKRAVLPTPMYAIDAQSLFVSQGAPYTMHRRAVVHFLNR